MSDSDSDQESNEKSIKLLQAQAKMELQKMEAQATARDVASKTIGKQALAWIFMLVVVGVVSSLALDAASLAPVIGLVATATMALIQLVGGIVNEAKKEEKPEITIIKELINRLDQKEPPMKVTVEGERVMVAKGEDVISSGR